MKTKHANRTFLIFTRIFNFRYWIDFDRMKSFTFYLANGFKRMFVPQSKPAAEESFQEAVANLNLSDEDLKNKQIALFRLCILMCTIAGALFGYAIYQLFFGSFKGLIISLVVMLIALALAFRYHFWYFQIKEKVLGCTLREWYRKGLLGEK